MIMIKVQETLMSQAEKWKATWKLYLSIFRTATIICAGCIKGIFYLSALLLHVAVKASVVQHALQVCTVPDSQQRRDMRADMALRRCRVKNTIVTCGRIRVNWLRCAQVLVIIYDQISCAISRRLEIHTPWKV